MFSKSKPSLGKRNKKQAIYPFFIIKKKTFKIKNEKKNQEKSGGVKITIPFLFLHLEALLL